MVWIKSFGNCLNEGPELQCLLKAKEDLSKVLIFQDAKNNVLNLLLKSK